MLWSAINTFLIRHNCKSNLIDKVTNLKFCWLWNLVFFLSALVHTFNLLLQMRFKTQLLIKLSTVLFSPSKAFFKNHILPHSRTKNRLTQPLPPSNQLAPDWHCCPFSFIFIENIFTLLKFCCYYLSIVMYIKTYSHGELYSVKFTMIRKRKYLSPRNSTNAS